MLSLKIEAEIENIKDAKKSFGKRRFKREKGRHLASIYGAPFVYGYNDDDIYHGFLGGSCRLDASRSP